jgi:hypothetical protein
VVVSLEPKVDLPLDPGIREAVLLLRAAGIETFESCEGGAGHASPDPIVKFHGNAWSGYHAFSVAMTHGLPVLRLCRVHDCEDGQLTAPYWMLVFRSEIRRLPSR